MRDKGLEEHCAPPVRLPAVERFEVMPFSRIPILACWLALVVGAWARPPVLDNPLYEGRGDQSVRKVEPVIPVGKTLLMPFTASEPDGGPLSYAVSSSNPNILVRSKTGNPVLRMVISHAGDGETDLPYSGTMEFMLFRDWLPITTGYIAGMAQAGFYDNLTFHRIANLGGAVAPEAILDPESSRHTPVADELGNTGFIFQGGDPLGTGGGGPGMVDGDASTSWKFQNEFFAGTIFSGRGQLAMANGGTQTGYALGAGGTLIVPDYLDTNGSQFFITDGQPRHLDFKHNTFGQLLRGWNLLPKMRETPTTSSTPKSAVKIVSARVVPNESDAVLVLSAKAVGNSVITVTVSDSTGQRATRKFSVSAVPDTSNANPFLRRMPAHTTLKETPAVFGLEAVDLEFDYLDIEHSLLPLSASLGPKGTLLAQNGRIAQVQPNAGYAGLINEGFSVRQFSISQGGFLPISDYTNAYIAAGDRPGRAESVTFHGAPNVAIENVVVAMLADVDAGGAAGNFSATINWGDGTPIEPAPVGTDQSLPGSSRYVAVGNHTFPRAGTYSVVVNFVGNNGARATAYSTAVVTAGALRAFGENLDLSGSRVLNRLVATFTDTDPAAPNGYIARIDWGDGKSSFGTIKRDRVSGKFLVRGTHGYQDSESFSVRVRIHRKNDAATAGDAFAWTTIKPSFKALAHLPPFPHPKLTIAWNSGPSKSFAGVPGPNYQVTYNGVFVIINSGNLPLASSQLRFWLSNDPILDLTGPNRDTPLVINGTPALNIIPFPAGAGGNGNFAITMPKGESAGRKFLLSEAVYSNPIADADGTAKVIVTGPLPPSVVLSGTTGLHTTEAGGTTSFKVVLDTPPVSTASQGESPNDSVTIPLESSLTTEGTVSPASLIFTAANWNIPQTVTVTGVDDNVADGNKIFQISLKAAVSADPLLNGLVGGTVNVVNDDNENAP